MKGAALDQMLDETLLGLCTTATREEIEREVDLLIRRYAPDGGAEALIEAADVLEAADAPPGARARLRLWSASLRRRAGQPSPP